ncbi:MAG: hypothetical protein R2828_19835 [Saprospiraceae bacterium]
MMKTIFPMLSLFLLLSTVTLQAQEEATERPVYAIEVAQNMTTSFEGNLEQGATMPLRWAENSSVACFPGTRFIEFQGNHVFYRMTMPAYSDLKITVKPKDGKSRINLYALRLGLNNMSLPPDISSAISCEAAYPLYAGTPNFNIAAEDQSVSYISVNKAYQILIGVAGAKGFTSGDYILEVQMKER